MLDIATIEHFNLWSFDLNLLVAFDAMMKDRNVTKAAARLRLQQPAMSHNLSTLRRLLQDDLFVRVGHTMVPTPRAEALAEQVGQILANVHHALSTNYDFDPKTEARTFRLGFSSELEVVLMPELSAVLRRSAPGIKILGRPAAPDKVFKLLDDRDIDLAVGGYEDGGMRHHREKLFERSLTCCFNSDLVRIAPPIDQLDYLRLPHALVSQSEAIEGCLDRALKRAGVALNVAMAAPEFLTVLTAVSRAPLLATLPSRIVDQYASLFGLTASALPLVLEIRPISMVWQSQLDKEPSSIWLRSQIRQLLSRS